jgi:hypothetical protein
MFQIAAKKFRNLIFSVSSQTSRLCVFLPPVTPRRLLSISPPPTRPTRVGREREDRRASSEWRIVKLTSGPCISPSLPASLSVTVSLDMKLCSAPYIISSIQVWNSDVERTCSRRRTLTRRRKKVGRGSVIDGRFTFFVILCAGRNRGICSLVHLAWKLNCWPERGNYFTSPRARTVSESVRQ